MSQYDFGTLLALLLTAVLGPTLGPKLGPILGLYSAVLFASVMGSALALWRREPGARPSAAWFMVIMVGATQVVTVPATVMVVDWLGRPTVTVQVAAPLTAIVIAGIGHDWVRIVKWAVDLASRVITRRVEGVPVPPPAQQGDPQ